MYIKKVSQTDECAYFVCRPIYGTNFEKVFTGLIFILNFDRNVTKSLSKLMKTLNLRKRDNADKFNY